jgi:hypothetical protein
LVALEAVRVDGADEPLNIVAAGSHALAFGLNWK